MSTLRELIAQHHLVAAGDPNLGPFDDLPLPDEEQKAMQARADQWCSSLKPRNAVEMWLLEQVAIQALRLERCQVDEAARRDDLARRAVESWDEDHRLAAEDLAARLPRSPALVALRLRGTQAGAAWLLARWATLRPPLESGTPWTPAQRTHALDLLGTPAADRAEPSRVDLPPADLLALVSAEVDRLQTLHDGPLAALDRRDRATAARGLGPAIDAALAPLRRLERSIARRMEWLLTRFQAGRRLAPILPHTDPGDLPAASSRSRAADDDEYIDPRTIPPPARKPSRRARASTPPPSLPLDPRRPLPAHSSSPRRLNPERPAQTHLPPGEGGRRPGEGARTQAPSSPPGRPGESARPNAPSSPPGPIPRPPHPNPLPKGEGTTSIRSRPSPTNHPRPPARLAGPEPGRIRWAGHGSGAREDRR